MMSRADAFRFLLMIGGLLALGYFTVEKITEKHPRFEKVKKVIYGIAIFAMIVFLKFGLLK